MSKKQTKLSIEELYIPGQKTNNNYICENFIIYPQDKEKFGGFIFGIIELKATPKPEGDKIIQTIVNTLKEKYYQQIITSPQPYRLNLETVLEHALQKTNEVLTEMIQIGYINLNLDNLNFLIAVAKPKDHGEIDMFFSHRGLIQAYLIHKTQKGNFKVINIIDNISEPGLEKDHPSKIFSSTVSGNIYTQDRLVICTEILTNIIPPYQISKVCAEHNLAGARDYFRALIQNGASASNFLTHSAIIIGSEKKLSLNQEPVSQQSVNDLISTTEHTEKLLMPTLALNIKAKFKKAAHNIQKKQKAKKDDVPKTKKKTPLVVLYYLGMGLKSLGSLIWALVRGKKKIKLSRIKNLPRAWKIKILRAPIFSKLVAVILVVLVIGLASSIFLIKKHREETARAEAFTVKIEQVKLNLNEAEANLIYQREKESLEKILQTEKLFQGLTAEKKEEKLAYDGLALKISKLKNKLLHIEKSIPQIVTELVVNGQPINGQNLEIRGQTLVATANKNFYLINAQTKNIDKIVSTLEVIKDVAVEDEIIYIVAQNNGLQKYENAEFSSLDTKLADATTAFTIYNNSLYTVQSGQAQIFKQKKSGAGFSEPQGWLKIDSPLKNPQDFCIDGNIFALDSNNQIFKFYGGKAENFMEPIIEPKVKNLTKLFTSLDTKYLYLLDPAGKRVVTLNKEGELVRQYLFETLPSLTDFTVNEKEKAIYLLSENKLYQATLTHL